MDTRDRLRLFGLPVVVLVLLGIGFGPEGILAILQFLLELLRSGVANSEPSPAEVQLTQCMTDLDDTRHDLTDAHTDRIACGEDLATEQITEANLRNDLEQCSRDLGDIRQALADALIDIEDRIQELIQEERELDERAGTVLAREQAADKKDAELQKWDENLRDDREALDRGWADLGIQRAVVHQQSHTNMRMLAGTIALCIVTLVVILLVARRTLRLVAAAGTRQPAAHGDRPKQPARSVRTMAD